MQLDLKGFEQTLAGSKTVLVLMPENPDFDTVAAATSLSVALKESGKEVTTACSSPMLVEFNRLVGVNKVTDTLDNKNLTISFQDYDASQIEKVSYNIEDGRFMLVVSPKTGTNAPNQDQVIVGYKGIAADVVILVGAQNQESLGKYAGNQDIFSESVKIAVLGNAPASGFKASELINPIASSVSEVALQAIEGLNLALNPDIATNLFMGLRAGTNNFQNKVTAETFATASRLLSSGARLEPVAPVQAAPQAPEAQETPKEWMEDPKVYKGTTLS